jgi:serine/threonine protein kinase
MFKVRYKAIHSFELGTMYVASTIVAYFIQSKFEKFLKNALRKIENFKFRDKKMESQFKTYLPNLLKVVHTREGTLVVFRKKEEELLLKDIMISLNNEISPRHVAWIMSSLYNTACFLSYNDIVHNAISPETLFISPPGHYGALLGGWWYATNTGKPLLGLPKKTIEKTKAIRDGAKVAKVSTDLELIRVLGRDLLNDPAGNKLLRDKNVPKPLALWLCCSTTTDSAVNEYADWNKVLDDSWGKRVYYNLDVTEQNVYKIKE